MQFLKIYILPIIMAFNCLTALLCADTDSQQAKPNIILIMTDDQGFDDYGFRQAPMETPNMDKMAMEGVRFDRFYTAPACAYTFSFNDWKKLFKDWDICSRLWC